MANRIKKRNLESRIYLRINRVAIALPTVAQTYLYLDINKLTAKAKFCFRMIHMLRLRVSTHDFELLAVDYKGLVLGRVQYGELTPHESGFSGLLEHFESMQNIELILRSDDFSESTRCVLCEVEMIDAPHSLTLRKVLHANTDTTRIVGVYGPICVEAPQKNVVHGMLYKDAL